MMIVVLPFSVEAYEHLLELSSAILTQQLLIKPVCLITRTFIEEVEIRQCIKHVGWCSHAVEVDYDGDKQ
jgi:hypothetical protein